MHKAWPIIAATSVGALLIAGCGSSGEAPLYAPGDSAVTVPAAQVAPTVSSVALSKAAATRITATESEFRIHLSRSTVKAGSYTFVAHNAGTVVHALTVDGPGVEDRSTSAVAPGATKSLTVKLRKGRYTIYCPVGDHRSEGMVTTLRVS